MQHLRQCGMHSLALSGGKDHDVERGSHRREENGEKR
jgi:hypothetical protein